MIDNQPNGGYMSVSNNSDVNKKMCKLPCPTLTVALHEESQDVHPDCMSPSNSTHMLDSH
jgi:hypothetical protein